MRTRKVDPVIARERDVAAANERLRAAIAEVARGPHSVLAQGACVECYRCGASGTWDDSTRAWVGSLDRSCR